MWPIIKKWRLLIFCGIALIILAYIPIPDLPVEAVSKVFQRKSQSSVQINPHWQRFTNHEGGFVVEFPSRPFESPVTLSNNPAIVSYRQFVSVLGGNCFMAAALVTSFPTNLTEKQINFLLDSAINGALQDDDKLIVKRNITAETYQGREIEFQKADKYYIRMRYYQVGNTLEQLTILMPLQDHFSTNVDYFFNSFSLITKADL